MKKTVFTIFLVLLVFYGAAGAFAAEGVQRILYMEEYEPVYSVDVDNRIWDVAIDNGDITGVSEDGMMWFFLGDVKDAKDVKDAVLRTEKKIGQYLTDIEITQTVEDFTVNGLRAYAYEALASANGKDVILFSVWFQVETGEVGVLLFVMDPLAEELYFEDIMKMTASVSRR